MENQMEKKMEHEMDTGFKSGLRFPRLGVAFWGLPIIRTIVFGGLYWGPPIWETTIFMVCWPNICACNSSC